MTTDNGDEVQSSFSYSFSFDELQDIFDEQHLELERLFTKYCCLGNNFETLTQENDVLNTKLSLL